MDCVLIVKFPLKIRHVSFFLLPALVDRTQTLIENLIELDHKYLFEHHLYIDFLQFKYQTAVYDDSHIVAVNNPKKSGPTLNETFLGMLYPTENYKV